jgi:phosphate acetyltransferase
MKSLYITSQECAGAARKALSSQLEGKNFKLFKLFCDCSESDESVGATLSELYDALAKNTLNDLIQSILAKYKAAEERSDFVICAGVPRKKLGSSINSNINYQFAKNLGAPIINLIDAAACSDLAQAIHIEHNAITKSGCAHFATFVKNTNEAALADINSPLPLYAVDDEGTLSSPDDFRKSLAALIKTEPSATAMTPIAFEYSIFEHARANKKRIVLPESTDERILRAADIIIRKGVADITLLGSQDELNSRAAALGLDLSQAHVIDPLTSPLAAKYADTYYELRKAKGVTPDEAREAVKSLSYFGTMMVYMGDADGMVSGAIHTTSDTVRPALQIIKTNPGISIISSVFFMCLDTKVLVYGDCAINQNPTPAELAQIAISSADTAKAFGIAPKVALLSYSTGSSGKGADVDTVVEALKLVREQRPDIPVEGPIQYDAACEPSVARAKLPNSPVAGQANVFIFPDLNTGNNTYKAVQRSSGALAVGPVLQGLKKPVNDLSRGCLVADIVNTVAITAIQADQITKARS